MAWYDVSEVFRGRPYLYDPERQRLRHAERSKERTPRHVGGSSVFDAAGTSRTARQLDRYVSDKVPTC